MNKREFLSELEKRLDFMGVEERNDIMRDYIEHFDSGKRVGKSEKEIAADLGSIDEIVDQFEDKHNAGEKAFDGEAAKRAGYSAPNTSAPIAEKSGGGGSIVGAVFFGIFATLGIIVLFSLCLAGFATCLGLTVGGVIYIVAPFVILKSTAMAIGVCLASLGIFILSLSGMKAIFRAFKGIFGIIKASFQKGKRILTGGNR